MNILLRELLNDIAALRSFAEMNNGQELGQQLHRVLDYASNKLTEEREKERRLMEEIMNTYN